MKINDDARNKELENLFLKLDLDEDGHLSYELIENIFCKHLSAPQRSFAKQVRLIEIIFLFEFEFSSVEINNKQTKAFPPHRQSFQCDNFAILLNLRN